jgi:hypothetical protein
MLFPSTLFISPNPVSLDSYLQELGHTALENNPDIFIVSDYSVENIRSIKKFLSQKPYSHQCKIVYIPQADLLNSESQNTLLKNLEEPGENNYFFLTTAKPHALLPTVVSRCHQIRLSASSITPLQKPLVFSGSLVQKLALSESLVNDKSTVLAYFEDQLSIYQQKLISSPTTENSLIISKLIKAVQMLNANVDPKSTLDFLLLA